jgi:hypothetical protein
VNFTLLPLYLRRKSPLYPYIGGSVGLRTGLDDMEKRKIVTLPGLEFRPLGHPVRSHSLYRLSYPVRTYSVLSKSSKIRLLYGPGHIIICVGNLIEKEVHVSILQFPLAYECRGFVENIINSLLNEDMAVCVTLKMVCLLSNIRWIIGITLLHFATERFVREIAKQPDPCD